MPSLTVTRDARPPAVVRDPRVADAPRKVWRAWLACRRHSPATRRYRRAAHVLRAAGYALPERGAR